MPTDNMNYNKLCGSRLSAFLFVVYLRISFGQLTCYFGSTNSTLATHSPQLQTCSLQLINKTDGSTVNSSFSLHPEDRNISSADIKFCLVFTHQNGMSDYICDQDQVCKEEGLLEQFCYKGNLGMLSCCGQTECNSEKKAKDVFTTLPLVCYSDSGIDIACTGNRCMNRTTYSTNGTVIRYEYGCASNETTCGPDRPFKDTCTDMKSNNDKVVTCLCSGKHCNYVAGSYSDQVGSGSTSPSPAPLLFMTNPDFKRTQHGLAFVGTICAVAVLILLFTVLVIVGIRKFREHRSQHLTFTYTQLTADLAEERETDDEYMLIG